MLSNIKIYQTFFISLAVHLVLSEDVKDLTFPEIVQLVNDIFTLMPNDTDVKDDDITFYLATRSNPESILLDRKNPYLDASKASKFIIHGYMDNHRRSWYENLTSKFLNRGDYNVIQVDWEAIARRFYTISAKDTRFVGYDVAKFVVSVGFDPIDVHLIGHSLGAHIAGFAGKKFRNITGRSLWRITALDPAGPGFYNKTMDDRLDKSDAVTVDVIHTDAGGFGSTEQLGTIDIYVNGGTRIQPGCLRKFRVTSVGELIENSYCSHAKSQQYFAEWTETDIFVCKLCKSIEDVAARKCNSSEETKLRFDEVSNITGVCFPTTNLALSYF